MGSLTPGVTLIYENAKGVTYAREFGSTTRIPIGWEYNIGEVAIEEMWKDIRLQAYSNPSLQKALNNAIMIYKLSKDNPK